MLWEACSYMLPVMACDSPEVELVRRYGLGLLFEVSDSKSAGRRCGQVLGVRRA